MSDDLNKQIFKEEAYELLTELETTLLELEQDPTDMDLINKAFRALHTIKGSGSMFGFDDIADFTHEIETVFDRVRNGELPVKKDLITAVFQGRDHIQNLLDDEDDLDQEFADSILESLKRYELGVDSGEDEVTEVASDVAGDTEISTEGLEIIDSGEPLGEGFDPGEDGFELIDVDDATDGLEVVDGDEPMTAEEMFAGEVDDDFGELQSDDDSTILEMGEEFIESSDDGFSEIEGLEVVDAVPEEMVAEDSTEEEMSAEEMEELAGFEDFIDTPEEDGDEPAAEADDAESGGEVDASAEAEPAEEGKLYRVTVTPKSHDAPETLTMAPLFEEMRNLGELTLQADIFDVPPVDSIDPLALYLSWDALLKTNEPVEAIEDLAFFADVDVEIKVREVGDDFSLSSLVPEIDPLMNELMSMEDEGEEVAPVEAPAPAEPAAPATPAASAAPAPKAPAKPAAPAPKAPVKPAASKAPKKKSPKKKVVAEAASSIRVGADKLDKLVDLVGELVIVQARISQIISERSDPVMTALAEELERLSDELRDSTLGIRMLPIGTTFSKFRRLVRDLSSELGKEIGLETVGAETELDKTVIERLGDPLVHLLRNSLDHGIESPEARVAAGKPRQGTIVLSAEHSGGEVLIRITDDGKGMDPEMLRQKAIDKGIIQASTELTEKETYNLIFAPGFSTAAAITNVSGRGVGMDVVKRAIDSLRGRIQVDSHLGQGTVITIKLPLTLAIIDGLQIKVADEFFVIPLSLVEECVELARDKTQEERGQQIMHLRGEIVPYIYLREYFEIEGGRPDIEQVVITGSEGSRVGIVVDSVIGEHQTVIKSLGRVYRDVEGISGATIKGDGSMALILDVPRLVRLAASHENR
ncbi:MAG: chemotaxis protein CheW [Desulfovibrio sp.]